VTPERLPHRTTGDAELDGRIRHLIDGLGPTSNPDQLVEMLVTVTELAQPEIARLDAKIAAAALDEMAHAFKLFAPYRDTPKITMFGSARTLPADPLYAQARELARAMAANGWMVVTGAGPGIMAAGLEGAGRDKSIGVNIRLPFEQSANEFIAADPKLIEMRYFFTRKLMLVKESAGFVVLPGGFGTLDEAFELLTLMQTGKAGPAPVVLLEVPGGTYWHGWDAFVRTEVAARGYVSEEDDVLYRITDDVTVAADELLGFYRNYHSHRYVGDVLVLRLKARPTADEVRALGEQYGDISTDGAIREIQAFAVERADHPQLPRLGLRFDRMQLARLRMLIDAINDLPSAPSLPTAPPPRVEPT
jgi:hypothetical protein